MKLYVGITDRDWFRFLRAKRSDEMNFWRPRSTSDFGAISPGELFLFKTRYPENKIVGGAFFVRHSTLPLDLAWTAFGEANGVPTLSDFRAKISSIRGDRDRNPLIGCTVLTQPFYLGDDAFLTPPSDFSSNIVMGKLYDSGIGEGVRLYEHARNALITEGQQPNSSEKTVSESVNRYGAEFLFRPRLGQGGFRVSVMDEYDRRCAITGERTLPVLEAAHIQPYSEKGPHEISNGLFLRSDLHTLFDRGYLTVTNDYRVEVSSRIREEFSNGREYYALHGKELKMLPSNAGNQPSKIFLEWHQNNCFMAG